MDLRMYLEEDMISFLDKRLSTEFLREQTAKPRKEEFAGMFADENESSLFTALDNNDVEGAKKILHKVKEEILQFPVGSIERKEHEAVLHTLYQKFKHYIETTSTLNKFENDISSLGAAPKQVPSSLARQSKVQAPSPKPLQQEHLQELPQEHAQEQENVPASPEKEAPSLFPKKEKKAEQNTAELPLVQNTSQEKPVQEVPEKNSDAMDVYLLDIAHALSSQDVKEAHKAYASAKKEFTHLSQEQKTFYHAQLLSLHKKIAALLTTEKTTENSELHTIERALTAAMHEGDLHEAMLHYEELRDTLRTLSQQERAKHIDRAKKYYSWIMDAWHAWQTVHPALEEKEKRLSGKP